MLQRAKEIVNTELHGIDGSVGKIKDIYFDDLSRHVRYLVVDTGSWLNSREVLLAPHYFLNANFPNKNLHIDLTKQQVEDSPPVTADMPVSRQYEERLHTYFGWQPYWETPFYPLPGVYSFPIGSNLSKAPWSGSGIQSEPIPDEVKIMQQRALDQGDPHLRSFSEIKGYRIHASDGEIGHIIDLLLDSDSWRVTHLVVDTRNWLPGHHVVIDAAMIKDISWDEQNVGVSLTREEVRNSPAYDPSLLIDEDFQASIASYYGTYQQSRTAWLPTREVPRPDL